VKREYGPVPRAIVPVLRELEENGALVATDTKFHGYTKKKFEVLTEPDTANFSSAELALVDASIKIICEEHTARSISEKSHDHIWHAAKDGEVIPYFTVFAIAGEIGDDELEWARQELESLGE
jgi:hypothetical protein